MIKFIKSKLSRPTEKKSNQNPFLLAEIKGFFGDGRSADIEFRDGNYTESFNKMTNYYASCSPVFSAIDLVTEEFAKINPVVYSKSTDEFTDNHPVLSLLQNPGDGLTYCEFAEILCMYYLITGNAFVLARGSVNAPPVALSIVSPNQVSFNYENQGGANNSGAINGINLTLDSECTQGNDNQILFKRTDVGNSVRFINSRFGEIWHISRPNPYNNCSSDLGFGMSKLMPVFPEIDQFCCANKHNLSLLQKGLRPTGWMSERPDSIITDDDKAAIQQQLYAFQQGARNAGNVMVVPKSLEFHETAINNRDMDFVNMKNSVSQQIYNVFQIPLALMTPDIMTLSNYQTATVRLYDGPVLGAANKIFAELSAFLMHRYGGDGDSVIAYDPNSIPALQSRRVAELTESSKLGIFSDNEQRGFLGIAGYAGGDTYYKPSNLVPVGRGGALIEEPVETQDPGIDDEEKNYPQWFAKWCSMMRTHKDSRGRRLFSDEKIKQLGEKYRADK